MEEKERMETSQLATNDLHKPKNQGTDLRIKRVFYEKKSLATGVWQHLFCHGSEVFRVLSFESEKIFVEQPDESQIASAGSRI